MARSTYEKFDYRLRPAKNVERKWLVQAWERLNVLRPIESYRYVGMGSMFFNDFVLVHRRLGIRDMVSIERDAHNEERFRHNAPLDCIDVKIGTVSDRLPELGLEEGAPAIVWLDYESRLDESILSDVREACSALPPKSLLLVTFESSHSKLQSGMSSSEEGRKVRSRLRRSVGHIRVPTLEDHEFAGWNAARVARDILTDEIQETLGKRNGALAVRDELRWQQLHNFIYADGRPMVSVGGVIGTNEHVGALRGSGALDLAHAREDSDACFISVPILTQREVLGLLKGLPVPRGDGSHELESPGLHREECEDFKAIYQVYPVFTETEFM